MLINSEYNGATERPGTSNDSLFVFLAGPIRYWWTPGVENSRQHKLYMHQRDAVHEWLSADYLVYAPHRAWRGPWNEVAQRINDDAVLCSHAVVYLTMDDVPAEGTDAEVVLAMGCEIPVHPWRLGDQYNFWEQAARMREWLEYVDLKRRAGE